MVDSLFAVAVSPAASTKFPIPFLNAPQLWNEGQKPKLPSLSYQLVQGVEPIVFNFGLTPKMSALHTLLHRLNHTCEVTGRYPH